jgi:hypothetical protein
MFQPESGLRLGDARHGEAKGTGEEGEARRRVWVTKSEDNGKKPAKSAGTKSIA